MSDVGRECETKCAECGRNLVVFTKSGASCPKGHGKIISKYVLKDLPKPPKKRTL